MKTELLSRAQVIAIVTVTMLVGGTTNGQDVKKTKSNDSPNVFVWQSPDNADEKLEIKKSGDNVFVVKQDEGQSKGKKKKKPGVMRWEFKSADDNKPKDQVVRLHAVEGKPGQHVIVVGDDDGSGKKEIRIIGRGEDMGHWIQNEGEGHQLILVEENGNMKKVAPGQGDDEEASGEENHFEFEFEGADEIHEMIHNSLKEHGLSADDENVDVQVQKTDDGKIEVRVTAGQDGGQGKMKKKRVQWRVEKESDDDEEGDDDDLRVGHPIQKIEIKRDDENSGRKRIEKRQVIRRQSGDVTDKNFDVEIEWVEDGDGRSEAPQRRIVEEKRDMRFGPSSGSPPARGNLQNRGGDSENRLNRMEKKLDALENKIDRLIRSLESNRGRNGARGSDEQRR